MVLTETPYTIAEAEKAGGLNAASNAPKRQRPAVIDPEVLK